MFNRKSQTILSDHYTKLIDHSDDEDDGKNKKGKKQKGGAASVSLVGGDDEDQDDFITIKRRDHDLNEAELPSSSYLSKRKLKQGQSKKAMLSTRGNPTKLVFDDEGDGHAIYELGDLDDFEKQGDAQEQQKRFVELEKEKLKEQDVKDKERQKELRREKKRKRKEIERGVSFPAPVHAADEISVLTMHTPLDSPSQSDGESGDEGGYEFAPTGDIIHPDFDDVELPSADSDDDLDRPTFHSSSTTNGPNKKKQRRARFDDDDHADDAPGASAAPQIDLEALALQALGEGRK